MATNGKISAILLMLIMAGTLSLNAQRGGRGMRPDSAIMNRPGVDMRQRLPMARYRDSLNSDRMPHRMGPGQMHRMDPFMSREFRGRFRAPAPRYREAFRQPVRPMRPQEFYRGRELPPMRVREAIPGLTEKQREQIADLRTRHREEMNKLRDDMQKKIEVLREEQRSKLRGLLNDEQKKWIDENPGMGLRR